MLDKVYNKDLMKDKVLEYITETDEYRVVVPSYNRWDNDNGFIKNLLPQINLDWCRIVVRKSQYDNYINNTCNEYHKCFVGVDDELIDNAGKAKRYAVENVFNEPVIILDDDISVLGLSYDNGKGARNYPKDTLTADQWLKYVYKNANEIFSTSEARAVAIPIGVFNIGAKFSNIIGYNNRMDALGIYKDEYVSYKEFDYHNDDMGTTAKHLVEFGDLPFIPHVWYKTCNTGEDTVIEARKELGCVQIYLNDMATLLRVCPDASWFIKFTYDKERRIKSFNVDRRRYEDYKNWKAEVTTLATKEEL